MSQIFNRHDLKEKRQQLRNETTLPECLLWQSLRGERSGVKFRRQHSVGHYILDFYCPALRLAVELDGYSHDFDQAQVSDAQRTEFLETSGIMVIRVQNRDVLQNLEGVVKWIELKVSALQNEPLPNPPLA